MEPIEVITHCKNPEYPTRVTIIDLYGKFEHAGDYTPPHYTYSIKVEVKFNKVIDGKEENLISCTLWTVKDSTPFNFQEDDLDEGSVEEWFLEGLSEDLSFHGFEGLEKLDFYALGVPTNDDGCGKLVEYYISDALNKCVPNVWKECKYLCSDLFFQKAETKPSGRSKTIWNIDSFTSRVSEEWIKKIKEEALNAYEGFLWRTRSYATDTVRSYKQASFEGMKKDLAHMAKLSQELAFRADSEAEEQYWLLKRGTNLKEQLDNCHEWMNKLGIEHKTFEEYINRPFD